MTVSARPALSVAAAGGTCAKPAILTAPDALVSRASAELQMPVAVAAGPARFPLGDGEGLPSLLDPPPGGSVAAGGRPPRQATATPALSVPRVAPLPAAAVLSDGDGEGGGCSGSGVEQTGGDGPSGGDDGGGQAVRGYATSTPRLLAHSPRSISEALGPSSLHHEQYRRFHPYLTMTKRFLGEYPSFYPILALSRVAINTHVGLFAAMFHCPAVDMRVPTYPSPELRRTAFLVASSRFSCSYCTAHACSFGDMLRGSLTDRARRGGRPPRVILDAADPSLSTAERVVVAFAAAAVVRPLATAELRTLAERAADVAAVIGARGLEVIKAVVAFTGALNTVMDVQGVVLEPAVQAFAMAHMPPPSSPGGGGVGVAAAGEEEGGLWVPSAHHRNWDVKVGGGGEYEPAASPMGGGAAATTTHEWDSWGNLSGSFRLVRRWNSVLGGSGGSSSSSPLSSANHGGVRSSPASSRSDGLSGSLPLHARASSSGVSSPAVGERAVAAAMAPAAAVAMLPLPSSPRSGDASTSAGGMGGGGGSSGGGGGGGGGRRANMSQLVRTIKAASSGLKVEAELYEGIPSSSRGLNAWAVARLGTRGARFLSNIRGLGLRRACCFALRENVLYNPATDGPGVAGGPAGVGGWGTAAAMPSPAATPARHWTLTERLALFYVFARVTKSPALGDDAVTCMATATGQLRSDIRCTWETYYEAGNAGTSRADVARRLVLSVGVGTENISAELVACLTDVLPPGAVVELASLLSFLEMWRRLRVLFSLNDLVR